MKFALYILTLFLPVLVLSFAVSATVENSPLWIHAVIGGLWGFAHYYLFDWILE